MLFTAMTSCRQIISTRSVRRTSALRRYVFLFMTLLVTGCATTDFAADARLRPGTDLPDQFLVGAHDGAETREAAPGEGCRNPLVDPRDGTRIVLVRSSDERGDYEVPTGRYGVSERELLRIDCGTGRALGIVRR